MIIKINLYEESERKKPMKKRIITIILFMLICITFPKEKIVLASSEEDFKIRDGILYAYKGNDTSITIPDSVTEIWEAAFLNNTQLISVTIPESVTVIHRRAFS